ncbi:MAG: 2-dehydropantoate 2-reductase [Candidatus Accumulibacter sp.]|jgi:2-dehydropantoate 2-reductase|nr:2-dehydropantoate 2-reductase [Accumulibacter sp.]
MKIAVMGAGAVGCYYGGMLARAGNDVVLIARPSRVDAIREKGLYMETTGFREYVQVRASTEASAVAGAELVLCAVKSPDTLSAADAIAPHIDPNAFVLSLQNGVDNADRLRERLKNPVASAVVYVAAEMAGPAHVKHHGRGELVFGPTAVERGFDKLFIAAGVPIEVSDNVIGSLWAKLILNCVYNPLSAITQLSYERVVAGEGAWDVMRDIADECLAVAKADGVAVEGDTWKAVERIAQTVPTQLSSTAQDVALGKRTEIDYINGYVLRRGRALGVPTPVNRAMHSLVKLIEGRKPNFNN